MSKMHRKHVPLRTCVVCRAVRPKRELARIVKPPEGAVTVDEKGKAAGRGAYVCRVRSCWSAVLKGGRLEHALRTTLSEQEREALRLYAERLPENQPAPVAQSAEGPAQED
jgi:predicted RNA-binding protein YlxR (DUF448 family)